MKFKQSWMVNPDVLVYHKTIFQKGTRFGSKPIGVLWHDTGCSNPTLKRYVQPYQGGENYEEIEETLLEENTNQNDTNDGSVDKPVEAPAGEDVTTEVENELEYIQTPKKHRIP